MLERFLPRTEFDSYEDFKKNYRLCCPADFNFATHVVDAWAESEPDKRALEWCDDYGHSLTLTFREVSTLSRRAAQWLLARGVKKGDRVMCLLKRRWEYWITAVALHRIGAVIIPASYQLTAKDIAYRVDAAGVRFLIALQDDWIVAQCEAALEKCGKSLTGKALVNCPEGRPGWLDYSAALERGPAGFVADASLTAQDLMLIYFTSGTSGMPKMVCHNYAYPLGHIVTACYWQQVQNGGLHLTGVDSGWAKFGWGCIYGQWIGGSAILGYEVDHKFDAKRMIEVIREKRPTTLCVPGTVYRFMMREGLTAEDFSSVTHCCTAGEPLSPELTREFAEITCLTIHEGYGQSEGSVLVANFGWFQPRPGSMGKPSPLYDIALVGEDGRPVAPGDEGELVVRGLDKCYPEGLLRGYWVGDRLVPAEDENHIYHTGDMMWMDEDGYYWFIGRNDDIIKCSAYRIGPFEIESVLLTHPAVHECAITGAPDPMRGQVVKATIVLEKGYAPSERLTKELQNYVKRMTAPYKYPRVVEYVEHLEKTTSGKIIRNHLRKASEDAYRASQEGSRAAEKPVIRPAAAGDAVALLTFLGTIGGENSFLSYGAQAVGGSGHSGEEIIRSCTRGSDRLLIAEVEGQIVGAADLRAGHRPPIAHTAEIGLSVLRQYSSRGIGRALLEYLIADARRGGRLQVLSVTVSATDTAAASLCRRFGFTQIGCYPKFFRVDGKYQDGLIMNLYL